MKKEVVDLIKYRLEKARITLLDAKKYIKDATPESTVNRIYYAMFYKGLVDKELGRFYSEMLDNRQEEDYKDFVKFEKEDVKVWLEKAEEFINKIEALTLKIIEEEN